MTVRTYTIEQPSYTGRLRVRTVSSAIERLAAKAAETGVAQMRCAHGGGVANSYGYPAQTEAIVEVVFPPHPKTGVQLAIRYLAQLPAKKVTLGGAASAATNVNVRPIWDARFGAEAKRRAKRYLLRMARADIGYLAGGEEARRKREERSARRRRQKTPSLAERFAAYVARRANLPTGHYRKLRVSGRWIEGCEHGAYTYRPLAYRPYGDDRDLAAFRSEQNQERRRLIYEACGERVLDLSAMVLLHSDEYGELYDTRIATGPNRSIRFVRVVCPSTGAVYVLPCDHGAQTAHEAVASTFGLRAWEYQPTAQA